MIFYENNKDITKLIVKEKPFALFSTHDTFKLVVKFNVIKIVFKIFT